MKFTLRDLLWLVLVLSVAFSWFSASRKQEAELRSTIDRHNRLLEAWKAETAETIERYRQAALDPVAYQEGIARRDREMSPAQLKHHLEEARTKDRLYSPQPDSK